MDDFLFELQQLIAKNRIEEVIKILLNSFQKCESQNPDSKSEIQGLRNQIVLLSARYTETNDKINSGIIDPVHAGTAKNQLISAFLNTISKLPDHKLFTAYVNGLEEEKAWQEAVDKNSIEGYRFFFSTYPNGKYKEETKRIIREMEAIEKTKAAEIKQKAAEEKIRRVQEEKQKIENQSKKQQGREEADHKVKKAKAELEELDIKRKEILAQKLKAKQELAEMDRKMKNKLSQEEKSKEAATPLTASGITAGVSEDNSTAASTSFFQKKNWLWFLLPILGLVFGLFEQGMGDMAFMFSVAIVAFAYGFTAFKFPLKPKRRGLISTAFFATFFVFGIKMENQYFNVEDMLVLFLVIFLPLSITVLSALYFRNKSLDKKK